MTIEDHHSAPNIERKYYYLDPQKVTVPDFPCEKGWILDIGGGGEGIIGHIKGKSVVAIDLSKRELEETSNDALKVVMDARELKFIDNSFNTVTAFFSLMYMAHERSNVEKVFKEISRVIKPNGIFLFWDVNLDYPDDFDGNRIAHELKVHLPNGIIDETGYGVRLHKQSMEEFIKIAKHYGFSVKQTETYDKAFFVEFAKN